MAVEITIDYNSDQVIIASGIGRDNKKITISKPKNMIQLQILIYEVVNAVVYAKMSRGVKITRIDEDTQTTIDEW